MLAFLFAFNSIGHWHLVLQLAGRQNGGLSAGICNWFCSGAFIRVYFEPYRCFGIYRLPHYRPDCRYLHRLYCLFGVAKIQIQVIVEYALPLVIMLAVGGIIVFLTVRYFGPRMNKDSWFERSIFVYGYSTGVFAIGMLLLRICDPNSESATMPDTGFAESMQTVLEMIIWAVGPYMLANGTGILSGGAILLVFLACIGVSRAFKWWYKIPLDQRGAVHDIRAD